MAQKIKCEIALRQFADDTSAVMLEFLAVDAEGHCENPPPKLRILWSTLLQIANMIRRIQEQHPEWDHDMLVDCEVENKVLTILGLHR